MPPSRIAHYRVIAGLGSGAMGDVYRAVDERLGREVALKLLPRALRGDRRRRARMLREARTAGSLNHPGIVTLHDVGEIDGRTYLVMELVDGAAFSTLVTEGVTWRRAVELVAGVADALGVAHDRGVFHRDIKADNLMVTAAGQVKVLDFGLAKAPGPEPREIDPEAPTPSAGVSDSGSDETVDGTIMGTPQYMSPEQTYGLPVDARSEVFSLGVVLCELLVGKRPFDGSTVEEALAAVREVVPPVPSKAAPDREIPDAVDRIVARALAKDSRERFADMRAFGAALRATIGAPVATRRWPWAIVGVAGATIAILAVVLVTRKPTPPTIAVTSSNRLTFDPGCEEMPRFTPDGASIIYNGIVDGDYELLAMNRATRERKRLTTAVGWDYGVQVSYDGKHLAYIHRGIEGREGRVISIDGDRGASPIRLGAISGYPAWTRDGALLLGDTAGRVVRRELVGLEQVIATLPAGARPYHLLQLASGDVVVLWFTTSKQRPDGMVIAELDHGVARIVEEGLVDYEGDLVPDTRGDGYYFIRKGATAGNEVLWRRFGTSEPPIAVPGGLSPAGGVAVAPDGKALVFSSCTEQQVLARLRPDTPPKPITRGEWHDRNPVRVDRNRVLISSDRDGQISAWLLDPITGEAKPVPGTRDALAPSPSPDNAQVVFAAEHGRGGIAIVDVAAGTPRKLTTDPSDADPVFVHDGSAVVFERSPPGGMPRLWAIPIAGGEARPIAPPGSSQPAASPIDNSIAYVDASSPNGTTRLMLVDAAGGTPREIENAPRGDWHRPRFSPDGRHLLAVAGLVQLIEVALGGGAPTTVWKSSLTGGINSADYAPDGDGFIATIVEYNGELWLAEGSFP